MSAIELSVSCTQTPWFTLAPWELLPTARLEAIAHYLNQPETQRLLAEGEAQCAYPQAVRQKLHQLGLPAFLLDPTIEPAGDAALPAETVATFPHIAALITLCTAANASLGVTVGVNLLALLPIYIAGDAQQLGWMAERIERGDYAALLLSELAHGSDLLANETVALRTEDAATGAYYHLNGRKDLINGGSQHELLVVFARNKEPSPQPSTGSGSGRLRGGHDFNLLLVDRTAYPTQIHSPQRWHTLPTPAADIASIAFHDCPIPASQRLGKEGQGFLVVQQLLPLSRGGASTFAVGVAASARQVATRHAATRQLYGQPIQQLGAIGEHLQQMQALELLTCALSVKAIAMINALGGGAAYYAALAKYACCTLAEAAVDEGRLIMGSRGLLRDFPYHRAIGDVLLFATFDGTTHLLLDQLQWRLMQMAHNRGQAAADGDALLQQVQKIYTTPPQPIGTSVRQQTAVLLVDPVAYLQALSAYAQVVPLAAMQQSAATLLALVRHWRMSGEWEAAQALRFALAKLLSWQEALIAVIELADPGVRQALGITRAVDDPSINADRVMATVGWFGGKLCAELRRVAYHYGGATVLGDLADAESAFGAMR